MNFLEQLLALVSLILFVLCMSAPLKRTRWLNTHPLWHRILGFHTLYGIVLLITGLSHGVLAGKGTAMMTGKLAWMVLLILTLSSPLRKKMRDTSWRKLHSGLAFAACLLTLIHVIQAIIF